MKARIVSLALLLSATVVLGQGAAPWTTFSSAEGKCEIMFPSKPKTQGNKKNAQAILEALGGKAVYILGVATLPTEIAIDNKDVVKRTLDGGRDQTLKSFAGSKILKEKDITVAGKPGRDIDIDVPNLGIYRARFILTSGVFYQVVVLGPKDFAEGADTKKFRDSFKFQK